MSITLQIDAMEALLRTWDMLAIYCRGFGLYTFNWQSCNQQVRFSASDHFLLELMTIEGWQIVAIQL